MNSLFLSILFLCWQELAFSVPVKPESPVLFPVKYHGISPPKYQGRVIFTNARTGNFRCLDSARTTYVLKASTQCKDYFVCSNSGGKYIVKERRSIPLQYEAYYLPQLHKCRGDTLFSTDTLKCERNAKCEVPEFLQSPNAPRPDDYYALYPPSSYSPEYTPEGTTGEYVTPEDTAGEYVTPEDGGSTIPGGVRLSDFIDGCLRIFNHTLNRHWNKPGIENSDFAIFSTLRFLLSVCQLRDEHKINDDYVTNDPSIFNRLKRSIDETSDHENFLALRHSEEDKQTPSLFPEIEGTTLPASEDNLPTSSDNAGKPNKVQVSTIKDKARSESIKIWMEAFLNSVFRDFLNDDLAMGRVHKLMDKLFDVLGPLAKDLMLLKKQYVFMLRRDKFEPMLDRLRVEVAPLLVDVLASKLPNVLLNVSHNKPRVVSAVVEFLELIKMREKEREQDIIAKIVEIYKKYEDFFKTSREGHVFDYSLKEMREDVEAVFDVVSELFPQKFARIFQYLAVGPNACIAVKL